MGLGFSSYELCMDQFEKYLVVLGVQGETCAFRGLNTNAPQISCISRQKCPLEPYYDVVVGGI